MPTLALDFDAALLQTYNQPLPRYTSYPPATQLTEAFSPQDFQQALDASNQRQTPLSLYFHLPFCHSACYFCGCNVIVSNGAAAAENYLRHLLQEIDHKAALIDPRRSVVQVHWGGGTPNYLNLEQVETLWQAIDQRFTLAPQAEVSIEINPRYVDKNYIFSLRAMGFNRLSFGIQDFDPQVQKAVNRELSEKRLFEVMGWIKDAGFESVNVDLIYGLPHQTRASFAETVQKTIALDPNRIAVFNFAYVPWLKPVQKNIPEAALPSPEEKLAILKLTIEELTQNGYQFIGMDHFAKPEDELAVAQRRNELKRNFQGYSTQPDAELIGFGLTAISMLEDVYAQNHRRLKDYYEAVEKGQFPLEKGIALTPEDKLRREIIMELMCHFHLDFGAVSQKYGLDFLDAFAPELADLRQLEQDGLVQITERSLTATPKGCLLIRNIAAKFDSYCRQNPSALGSKAI
ncbi:MAG: oxygen-independent coproporphyrinogen III oxidase [Cyanobacteriota bacterium]|nr:oxygen-independent coproporphyrinogen III oxidase [Cyanobacteriota bacterium]